MSDTVKRITVEEVVEAYASGVKVPASRCVRREEGGKVICDAVQAVSESRGMHAALDAVDFLRGAGIPMQYLRGFTAAWEGRRQGVKGKAVYQTGYADGTAARLAIFGN